MGPCGELVRLRRATHLVSHVALRATDAEPLLDVLVPTRLRYAKRDNTDSIYNRIFPNMYFPWLVALLFVSHLSHYRSQRK